MAVRCRRQWYRRAWAAQHDWSRLALGDVEDGRAWSGAAGFPLAGRRSELRSQLWQGSHGLLHSIAQAGRLQAWRLVKGRRRESRAANEAVCASWERGRQLASRAPAIASSHRPSQVEGAHACAIPTLAPSPLDYTGCGMDGCVGWERLLPVTLSAAPCACAPGPYTASSAAHHSSAQAVVSLVAGS